MTKKQTKKESSTEIKKQKEISPEEKILKEQIKLTKHIKKLTEDIDAVRQKTDLHANINTTITTELETASKSLSSVETAMNKYIESKNPKVIRKTNNPQKMKSSG